MPYIMMYLNYGLLLYMMNISEGEVNYQWLRQQKHSFCWSHKNLCVSRASFVSFVFCGFVAQSEFRIHGSRFPYIGFSHFTFRDSMLCYRRMNYLSLKLFLDFYESVVPFKLVNVYGVCDCDFRLVYCACAVYF